ncbi:ATP-binding protein [Roseofilum sp. BLCC_M154]|uniref:ATP-binding protein n=1 Tax=Roseofilum acuticapitatum BLCC-M154 TaxID=3022444 RepID=A0ABT7AWW7_9CYAN|nr:ATP-binding protein [Roseofilum acuticapitatum]MDJ1171405.1 ATP-binding protein [Roseofilum acuticapitatum BLCC-M154]
MWLTLSLLSQVLVQTRFFPLGDKALSNLLRSYEETHAPYRNPHLAEAMKNLGYVQRFGIGIPIAQKELQKNGNPPAEFILEDSYISVIIRRKP